MTEKDSVTVSESRHAVLNYEQDGKRQRTSYSFYRGEHTRFYPTDESFRDGRGIGEYIAHGLMPAAPMITKETIVVAFGSCFASHIRDYLLAHGHHIADSKRPTAYVSLLGDGIVNSYAILQQFEWAWENRVPKVALWHGFNAEEFGYDESVRLKTKRLFDHAEVFILTYGLSEVWYDEPTGEVFWRAVPKKDFDPERHKYRMTTHAENLANIARIHALIRKHRPDAVVVQTLSPIALTATFQNVSPVAASAASKAILRSALDEFHRGTIDDKLFYFPSYEIALYCFKNHLMEDRKHVHQFVLDFNMKVFERYFCTTGLTDQDIEAAFRQAQEADAIVGSQGHDAVPRIHLKKQETTR